MNQYINPWTEGEIQVLKENYPTLPKKELKELLNRTWSSILHKAIRLKIKRKKHWTNNEIILLKKNYPALPKKELKQLFNKSWNSISHKAIRLKIRKERCWTKDEINILKKNYSVVMNINEIPIKRSISSIHSKANELKLHREISPWFPSFSKDLFYIIGVIEGDGNLYNGLTSYSIKLEVIDEPFAQKFYNALKNIKITPKIKYFDNSQRSYRDKDTYLVSASNKTFFLWYKHTVSHRWLTKQPKKYMYSFLEGFYESEGNLSQNGIIMSGKNKELMLCVKQMLDTLGYNPRLRMLVAWNGSEIWYVCIHKHYEVKKFLSTISSSIKRKTLTYGKFKISDVLWSPEDISLLKKIFCHKKNNELKQYFPNRSISGITGKAFHLGLKKVPA